MTTAIRSTMNSIMKGTVTGTVCGVALISLLVAGIAATGNKAGLSRTVQAQEETQSDAGDSRRFRCSNDTLAGRYAIRGDGFVPDGPPPAPMVPFATVSIMTLDGSGSLSNAVTVSRNGVISSNIDSGTYTVNADCTGKMTINIPAPPFQLTFDLAIADKGKEFYFISTTPSVVTHSAKRLQ
ncbi:MAG: hypothetical protein ACR2G5_14065 [Pyrinomonadaceae bacterium]